jgi:hypothetical protein
MEATKAMTNDQLTALYEEANGLDPKRHNPITTERIFTAMRAALRAGRIMQRDKDLVRCASAFRAMKVFDLIKEQEIL